jgi:hypothetical protein
MGSELHPATVALLREVSCSNSVAQDRDAGLDEQQVHRVAADAA